MIGLKNLLLIVAVSAPIAGADPPQLAGNNGPSAPSRAVLAAAILVVVQDEFDNRISCAEVLLDASGFDPVTRNVDGIYAFPAVGEGSYTIVVSAPGLSDNSVSTDIDVDSGEFVVLQVTLPGTVPRGVVGTVLDFETRAPLGDIQIDSFSGDDFLAGTSSCDLGDAVFGFDAFSEETSTVELFFSSLDPQKGDLFSVKGIIDLDPDKTLHVNAQMVQASAGLALASGIVCTVLGEEGVKILDATVPLTLLTYRLLQTPTHRACIFFLRFRQGLIG
jgi:hypothetical protein